MLVCEVPFNNLKLYDRVANLSNNIGFIIKKLQSQKIVILWDNNEVTTVESDCCTNKYLGKDL